MHDRSAVLSPSADDQQYADAPVIKGKMWSTMLDGFTIETTELRLKGELDERARAAAFAWKEGIAAEVPIWTPRGRFKDVSSGLSWGLTLLETNGRLMTFQLVVFVERHAERIGHDEHGTCRLVAARYVSAWHGSAVTILN